MSNQYTRQQIIDSTNRKIKNKIGILVSPEETCNEVVNTVNRKIDTRSRRRQVSIIPGLFKDESAFVLPKDYGRLDSMVDIVNELVSGEMASQKLTHVSIQQYRNAPKNIHFSVDKVEGETVVYLPGAYSQRSLNAFTLDSLTADGGTWEAFTGSTGVASSDRSIKGEGSVSWNVDNSTTTAGIKNLTLTGVDYSSFADDLVFVWQYIPDPSIVTSFELRLGTDDLNRRTMTVSSQYDKTVFIKGFNLLCFDLKKGVVAGTPGTTATYVELILNKEQQASVATGFATDHIMFKQRPTLFADYYSSYGWQNLNGHWKPKSTVDSDVLVGDEDEVDLYTYKMTEIAAGEVDEESIEEKYRLRYKDEAVPDYTQKNPSAAQFVTDEYVQLDNIGDGPLNSYY